MYPICVVGALNPRDYYISGMGTGQLNALRSTFERMIDVDTAIESTIRGANIMCEGWFFLKPPCLENGG
jgi:hypothetical protein